MTFVQIPRGAAVFLDANTLVYHFANHPTFGAACTDLVKRIEQHELTGFVSTHVLSELAHRLMTLEAGPVWLASRGDRGPLAQTSLRDPQAERSRSGHLSSLATWSPGLCGDSASCRVRVPCEPEARIAHGRLPDRRPDASQWSL